MRAIIRVDPVRDNEDHDVLYFYLDNGTRFIECQVNFDEDTGEWVLTGNDSECGRV